jgi:hypothetical protein
MINALQVEGMPIFLIVVAFMVLSETLAHSQACNPAVDGTYCAMAPVRNPAESTPPKRLLPTGLGEGFSPGPYERPATLGAITFSGRSQCVGLLRRVSCH